MNRICATFAGILLLSGSAMPALASAFYSQSAANDNAWISETANGAAGFEQAFDNFAFTVSGTSTEVHWTGWMLPAYAALDGFTISFYDDGLSGTNHVPGTLISSTSIVGSANQVSVGTHNGFGVFEFSAAVPFTGVAETQYWISIVADPQSSTTWHWANSEGGDSSFYDNNGSGPAGYVGTDLAFSLTNSTVPEPSSLVLCGSGLLSLAGVARRRFPRA